MQVNTENKWLYVTEKERSNLETNYQKPHANWIVQGLNSGNRKAYLFFAAKPANHAVGKFHFMIFICIMARITRVSFATARKPQPAIALLVMLACTKTWQRFAFLNSRIFGQAPLAWYHHLQHVLQICPIKATQKHSCLS